MTASFHLSFKSNLCLSFAATFLLAQSSVLAQTASNTTSSNANICDDLGLSPDSAASPASSANTATVASTALAAKASGATVNGRNSNTASSSSNSTSSGSSGTISYNAAQCSKGLAQSKANQAAVKRALAAKATLKAAADRYGVDWRMIAAIGIRESGFTNTDSSDGGEGIFQITKQNGVSHSNAWNLSYAANWVAKYLANEKAWVKAKYPKFTTAQVNQAAAALYNFGRGVGARNITGNPNAIDQGTTNNNYGASILNLMACF